MCHFIGKLQSFYWKVAIILLKSYDSFIAKAGESQSCICKNYVDIKVSIAIQKKLQNRWIHPLGVYQVPTLDQVAGSEWPQQYLIITFAHCICTFGTLIPDNQQH